MVPLYLFLISSFLVPHEQTLVLEPGRVEYYLSDALIVEGSIIFDPPVTSKASIVSNRLILTPPPPETLEVILKYQTIAADSIEPYSLYEAKETTSFEPGDSLRNLEPASTAERLEVHGSKTLSLSLNDKGSSDLSQGLSVNMNGNLAGVDVSGHIADEQGAFVPEGTTERIEDFDRISVSLSQKNWKVNLGDIDLSDPFAGYGLLERRIKGASTGMSLGPVSTTGAFGIEGTKRGHSILSLVDGKRGPYLVGSAESAEPLVPGSEKIWLDTRLLVRGSENDYVIDYSTGAITFNSRIDIRSRSRAEVDYTYTGSDYAANNELLGVSAGPFGVYFYREADSRTHLFHTWSDSQQAILDTVTSSEAVVPGGVYVGSGSGSYLLSDDHFIWAGQGQGDYDVSFRLVDSTSGDYVLNPDSGFFIYTGPDAGNYKAEILTTLPGRQEALGVSFRKVFGPLGIDLSAAGSRLTSNLYNDTSYVFGHAHRIGVEAKWEKLGLNLSHSFGSQDVSLPVRTSDAAAADRWNMDSLPTYFNEQLLELEANPFDSLTIGIGGGHLWTAGHEFSGRASSRAPFFDLSGDWLKSRQRASIGIHPRFGIWTPLAGFSWARYDTVDMKQNFEPLLGLAMRPLSEIEIKLTGSRRIDQSLANDQETWQDTLYYDRIFFSADYGAKKIETRLTAGLDRFTIKNLPADTSWFFLFGDMGLEYSPSPRINISANLSQHPQSIEKEVLYYLPVTPGTGDYKRDPETGEYIPDEKGDYKLEIRKEEGAALAPQRKANLAADMSLAPAKIWVSLDYNDSYYSNSFAASSRVTLLPGYELLNVILSPSYRNGRFPAWGGADERQETWRADAELRSRVHPSYLLRLLGSFTSESRARNELALRTKTESSSWLAPVIDLWLRLEPQIGFANLVAEEPYYYPELGQIEIRRIWISADAEKTFKDWRTSAGFRLTQRLSNISQTELPYLIGQEDPLGLTPSWNAGVERSIAKGLSVRLSYTGTLYPDERGLTNEFKLSAGMYF